MQTLLERPRSHVPARPQPEGPRPAPRRPGPNPATEQDLEREDAGTAGPQR